MKLISRLFFSFEDDGVELKPSTLVVKKIGASAKYRLDDGLLDVGRLINLLCYYDGFR